MKINLKKYSQSTFSEKDSAMDLITEFENIFTDVAKFRFIVYTPKLNIESSSKNSKKPVKEKPTSKLLFGKTKWDFEKEMIQNVHDKKNDAELIDRLLFHNEKEANNFIEVPRENIKKWLAKKSDSISSNEAIGISSLCETYDKSEMHIPMMDFTCPITEEYLNFIKKALVKAGCKKGVILNSGRSYHFYGLELLSPKEWQKFMGKCLLISPFTDSRFIAHRIISGKGILRINSTSLKTEVPKVVGFI